MSKILIICLFALFSLSCNASDYEEIVKDYLSSDSKIIAEIESEKYSFIFIAKEEIEKKDFKFLGDELFIVLDKSKEIVYSDLLFSRNSHQFYFLTGDYFAVIFTDRDTYKDLIIGFDFETGSTFKYSSQYKFISGFIKQNNLIYYSAEKYEKCISLLNTSTYELLEFGNDQIIVADFVEDNGQVYVVAHSINSYPQIRYYIIEDNELKEVNEKGFSLEIPVDRYLRDHRYDERKYSYLLEKYSD